MENRFFSIITSLNQKYSNDKNFYFPNPWQTEPSYDITKVDLEIGKDNIPDQNADCKTMVDIPDFTFTKTTSTTTDSEQDTANNTPRNSTFLAPISTNLSTRSPSTLSPHSSRQIRHSKIALHNISKILNWKSWNLDVTPQN